MTKYHGGKQRIGAEIARTIHQIANDTGFQFRGYLEPFCGMLGVYQHIPDLFGPRLKYKAGDLNESVIKMWKAAQRGWTPPKKCSKTRFYELKGNGKSSAEKGFVGHACSFRGVYFNMFFDKSAVKNSAENVHSMALRLKQIDFHSGDFVQFSGLKGYVIYCDPPYSVGRSRYLNEDDQPIKFDSDAFYTWVEKMAEHNLVFVSERSELPYPLVAEFGNEEKLYLID